MIRMCRGEMRFRFLYLDIRRELYFYIEFIEEIAGRIFLILNGGLGGDVFRIREVIDYLLNYIVVLVIIIISLI